jgi:hypothetical protein
MAERASVLRNAYIDCLVYCKVRTGSLNIIQINFMLPRIRNDPDLYCDRHFQSSSQKHIHFTDNSWKKKKNKKWKKYFLAPSTDVDTLHLQTFPEARGRDNHGTFACKNDQIITKYAVGFMPCSVWLVASAFSMGKPFQVSTNTIYLYHSDTLEIRYENFQWGSSHGITLSSLQM